MDFKRLGLTVVKVGLGVLSVGGATIIGQKATGFSRDKGKDVFELIGQEWRVATNKSKFRWK